MKHALAASALLILAACSSSSHSSSKDSSTQPGNTSTTLSPAEVAANKHAVKDVAITSCGPDAAHKMDIKGTVHNTTATSASYVVQLAIKDKSGKALFATAASATDVAPSHTKSWEAVTTAAYASGMTCAVTSVSVRATA